MMLVGGSVLAGCASTVADLPLIGLPANAPERPKEARAFLPVNDVPQDREGKMTTAEQQKIQAELIAARAKSAAAAAAK